MGEATLLPLGRYACSLDELHAAFVTPDWAAGSATRAAIWDDFGTALAMLNEFGEGLLTGVAWVGGSFVSSKIDPDDIDVTFHADGDAFDAMSNRQQQKLRRLLQKGRMRDQYDVRVDPFILVTRRVPSPWWPNSPLSHAEEDYYRSRGMWDDFWQRHRTSADKNAPGTVEDAEQVRGYLEVTL